MSLLDERRVPAGHVDENVGMPGEFAAPCPVSAIVVMFMDLAALKASTTFFELPEVLRPSSVPPAAP